MPRVHPRKTCRQCGRSVDECGAVSARGRCRRCWEENEWQNMLQLRQHRGPYFEHWRRQTVAAFGGTLLDDPQHGR